MNLDAAGLELLMNIVGPVEEQPKPVEPTIAEPEVSEVHAAKDEESSKSDAAIPVLAAIGTAGAAAAAYAVHSSKDSPKTESKEDHLGDRKPEPEAVSQKVTEYVDESTAQKKPEEELITEPAPQRADTGLHGKTVAADEVPEVTKEAAAHPEAAPTVIVSSPTGEDTSAEPAVEIVKPTPQEGEIFSNSVWNHSVSPFLQYSIENSPEGIRQRRSPADLNPSQDRPHSAGSDVVSSKRHRNIMNTFWSMFLFGWLGGVGRFFGGVFGKKGSRGANSSQ